MTKNLGYFESTKVLKLGSCAFRQWKADSHCKFIHGYQLTCKVWLYSDKLDERNWVFDFGNFKNIKTILENQFDHKFCVARDDPELETFKMLDEKGLIQLRVMRSVGIESTARWIYLNIADYLSKYDYGRVKLRKVEVWEHPENSAIYGENNV